MSEDDHEYDGIRYAGKNPPLVFQILYYGLLLWGVCFIGYFLFSGWSSHGEYDSIRKAKEARLAAERAKGGESTAPRTSQEKDVKELVVEGKEVFAARCATCHGADAKGGIGPDLTRKEFKYGRSPGEITASIGEGRPGGMPSFKNELSAEKLEEVAQYVLSLSGPAGKEPKHHH